jgi:proteasome lid subunit RPN8/RPN11
MTTSSAAPAPGVRNFGLIGCVSSPAEPRLLVFTYSAGFTLADFEAAMVFVVEYARAHSPIAIMSEVRGTPPAGAGERRRMADIVSVADRKSGRLICGSAVVTDSAIMRGVLTAVGWIHSPPYPLRPFADDHEARAWLRERLAEALGPQSTAQRG